MPSLAVTALIAVGVSADAGASSTLAQLVNRFFFFFSKQLRASPEASFLRRFFAPYLGGVHANVAELGWANDWGTFCASSGGSTTYLNALIYLQSYVL